MDSPCGLPARSRYVGGILLLLGLFTRPVAFIRGRNGVRLLDGARTAQLYPVLNNGDASILYCFLFLYMAFAGGGAWSLDRALWKR